MKLEDIKTLTREELRAGKMMDVLFDSFFEDYKEGGFPFFTDLKNALIDRAEELKLVGPTKAMATALKKKMDEAMRQEKKNEKQSKIEKALEMQGERYTEYASPQDDEGNDVYPQYRCDGYVVEDDGVIEIPVGDKMPERILTTPLIINKILRNRETGRKKAFIAWKDRGKWTEKLVEMNAIMKATKLPDLSDDGLLISSRRQNQVGAYIDKFLMLNNEAIPELESTRKMGWTGLNFTHFTPYDDDVVYDGDKDFVQKGAALKSVKGTLEAWMEEIRIQRKLRGNVLLIPMATALASPLISMLGINSFILDIYGATHNAKSVLLMLVASMIGDPEIGTGVIGDFKTTWAGVETLADMLNNLPMMLDDTKSADSFLAQNLEHLFYQLCSNKGKTRSNVNLGNDIERTWRFTVLTTGETPANEHCQAGGAIGRVFEMPTDGKIFNTDRDGNALEDAGANLEANRIAEFARANHGHFFRVWIEALKGMTKEEIQSMYREFVLAIEEKAGSSTKQASSLAIILTADKIVTDKIFQDGIYIDVESACELLADEAEIDDNARAYQYLKEVYTKDKQRFLNGESEAFVLLDADKKPMGPTTFTKGTTPRIAQLGAKAPKLPGYVNFFKEALRKELLNEVGVSVNNFVKWADKRGLLFKQGSQKGYTRKTTINGDSVDVYTIRLFDTDFVPDADSGKVEVEYKQMTFDPLDDSNPFLEYLEA